MIRKGITVALILVAVSLAFAAEQTLKQDTYTHRIIAPPASAGATYDLDFTDVTTNLTGGGVSDGDKGDITVTASGLTWTIDSGVVTLSKLATIATDSILGRATTGTGAPEVLTSLPFAFTGDVTRPADSNAQTIAAGAVTFAKSNFPVGKTIYVDGTNGSDGTGLAGRFDKPFAKISAAVAVATSGDTIIVGPGTFTETSGIDLPAGVSLYGSGIGVTTIVNSTTGIASGHADLTPGTGSIIADLTVDGSGVTASAPLGALTNDAAFTSALIQRVKLIGKSDGFYFDKAGADGLIAYDCIVSLSTADTSSDGIITIASTGTFEFYNTELLVNSTNVAARGITTNAGTVRFFGGRISATGSATLNTAANCAGGTLELHHVRINRDATGNDLVRSAGTLAFENVTRNDGAALSNSGTVTNLIHVYTGDIADSAVTYTKIQDVAANRLLGQGSSGPGSVKDLTAADFTFGIGSVSIANDAVTLAKIQNATANSKLLGSGDAGSGANYVEITLGSGLSMTGTTLSVTAGGGNVSNVGTPTDGQLSQWATSTTIRGVTPTSPIVSTGGGTPSITLDVSQNFAFTNNQSITETTANTNAAIEVLGLIRNTTGTAAAGIGGKLSYEIETDNGTTQQAASLDAVLSDPVTATYSTYFDFLLANSGAAPATKMRLFPSGGLSVNSTTDPGAGQINANTGFKVANAALNFSHLAGDFALTQTPSAAADKLIGRGNGGGAGDWQEITLGTNLSMTGTTLNATGGGATTFLGLTDTPSSYTGEAAKLVRVNAGETGLEFVTASGGGNVSNVGTPVDNQIAIWTTATTIEGNANLTFDGTNLDISAGSILLDDATGIKSGEAGNPELLLFTSVASAVNELTITNAATTTSPTLSATGSDTNIDVKVLPKGAGWLTIEANAAATAPTAITLGTSIGANYNSGSGETDFWNHYTSATGKNFSFYGTAGGIEHFLSINDGGALAVGNTPITTSGSGLFLMSAGHINWNNDTGFDRNAAGVVEINNGTAGQFRDLTLRSLILDGATSGATTLNAAAVAGTTTFTLPGTTSDLSATGGTNHVLKQTSASGAITSGAVTFAEVAAGTTAAKMTIGESQSVELDNTIADTTWTGITIPGTSGFAQTFGDLVYLDDTSSRWEECDANAAAAADGDSRRMLGIVVVTGTDGNACTILLQGTVRAVTQFPTFTAGAPLYVSETAGEVTQTQPTTADVVIRVVGYGLDQADTMYFFPSGTWTTHL